MSHANSGATPAFFVDSVDSLQLFFQENGATTITTAIPDDPSRFTACMSVYSGYPNALSLFPLNACHIAGWTLVAVTMIAAVAISYLAPLVDQVQRKISDMFAGDRHPSSCTASPHTRARVSS